MWIGIEAADPAEVECARAGLASFLAATEVSSEREVVVRVDLPAGVSGEDARVEMRDGVLLVHLPRRRG
jgi:hypothetical protein